MLLALGVFLIIGFAVGGEYLLNRRDFEFKRCIFSLNFAKRLIIDLIVSVLLFMAVNYDFFAVINMTAYKFLIFLAVGVFVVLLSVFFTACKGKIGAKRMLWVAWICLFCVLASEILIFNSRAIQSYEYEQTELKDLGKVTASEHIEGDLYAVNEKTTAKFEVTDISLNIKNLFIGVAVVNTEGEAIPYTVKIEATDDANALYITSIPTRKLYGGSSQYIPMQLRGVSDKLRITITPDASVEAKIYVHSITANTPKPFDLDFSRVLLLFVFAFMLYLISPGSPAHKIPMSDSNMQFCVTTVVAALEILMIFLIISSSSHYLQIISRHQAQYQELAESLLGGHLYLEEKVPDFLLEMENPYDYALRRAQGKYFYWDAALYNGRYYVYFGVVPCLLTYLPYHVLTGEALPNDIALFIFAIPFIIGCFALVKQIIKRYFPNMSISYVSYLIISLLLINGSGLIFMASYADMYSVPIMAALAFTVCGLSLWLSALNKKRLRTLKLVLGSLCMALVAGCRPNLLLFSALALPFFFGEVALAWKEKRIFKKSSVSNALAFAIPYIIVAAGIMWYNYSRFGSPFDFGANYNLTTNDMTSRGFVWDRMLPAAYSYLFQMPKLISTFPFIRFADFDTSYMGVTIRESTYGGIFSYSPLLLLILVIPFINKLLKKEKVYAPAVILALIGVITPLLDAQFAGILQRYFSDFSLMLYLSAIFILLAIINNLKNDKQRYASRAGLFVCVVAMLIYQGALAMRTGQITDVLGYLFWY